MRYPFPVHPVPCLYIYMYVYIYIYPLRDFIGPYIILSFISTSDHPSFCVMAWGGIEGKLWDIPPDTNSPLKGICFPPMKDCIRRNIPGQTACSHDCGIGKGPSIEGTLQYPKIQPGLAKPEV